MGTLRWKQMNLGTVFLSAFVDPPETDAPERAFGTKRRVNRHGSAAMRPGERSGSKSSLFVILRRRGVLSPVPLGLAGRFEPRTHVARHAIHDLVEGMDDRRRTS